MELTWLWLLYNWAICTPLGVTAHVGVASEKARGPGRLPPGVCVSSKNGPHAKQHKNVLYRLKCACICCLSSKSKLPY